MQAEQLIAADEFCSCYNIEVSFIDALSKMGLVEIRTMEQKYFIDVDQVAQVERMVRLHYDLNINLEGIDAINNLLQRVEGLQDEITLLRNRLKFYEENMSSPEVS